MKRVLTLSILLFGLHTLSAQKFVLNLKGDSVKVTGCDSAELIIENHTQAVPGFLFNTGNGRTIFKRPLQKLNDSLYLVGPDTLKVLTGLGGTLAPKQIAFGSSANNITGASSFLYDSIGKIVTIGPAQLSTGNRNIIFSYDLPSSATGYGNVAVGMDGLFSTLTNGIQNVAMGDYTMAGITSGNWNIGIAPGALQRLTTGNWNSGIGYQSLQWLTTQANNTGIGGGAFAFATVGNGNVGIGGGRAASFDPDMTIGDNNVFIGYGANDANSTVNNNIVIGNSSYTAGTSNSTLIGSSMSTSLSNIVGIGRSDQNVILGATSVTANNGAKLQVTGSQTTSSSLGVGGITSMTAKVHIAAGAATAGTAPIKLSAGTILTTPEDGAIEYDGTDYFITQGTSRFKLSKTLTGQLTTDFGAPSVAAGNTASTTLSVPGVAAGDVVTVNSNSGLVNPPSVIITAYVTASNTVTLRAYNAGSSTVTLASDTYRVRVIK